MTSRVMVDGRYMDAGLEGLFFFVCLFLSRRIALCAGNG